MTLNFKPPSTSKKVYIACANSGWPETFERATADEALQAFLSDYTLAYAVHEYREQYHYDLEKFDWASINAYLGSLVPDFARTFPPEAAIAFWASVLTQPANNWDAPPDE